MLIVLSRSSRAFMGHLADSACTPMTRGRVPRFPGLARAASPAPPGRASCWPVTAPVFVSVVPDTRGMLPQERYTYTVPEELSGPIRPGVRVQVPFGARSLPGLVVALLDQSDHADARPISAVLDEEPLLSEAMVGLAVWIADRYCAPAARGHQGDGAQGRPHRRARDRPAARAADHLRRHHRRAGRGHRPPAARPDRGAAPGRRPAPGGDRRRDATAPSCSTGSPAAARPRSTSPPSTPPSPSAARRSAWSPRSP